MSFVPSTCCPKPAASPFAMPARTAMEWALANPVLAPGSCAYESDTGKWKLGNGTDKYMDLIYQSESGAPGKDGLQGASGSNGINGIPGPACKLTIGSVTTGTTASATITGTPPNQVLNLVLPVSNTTSGGGGGGAVLKFVSQPQDESVVDGDAVVFTAEATQSAGAIVTYKWQSLPANTADQTKWVDVTAPPSSSLRIAADVSMNGMSYRCIAQSGSVSVTSGSAMLSVAPQNAGAVIFDAQPFDCTVPAGGTAIFKTTVTIVTGVGPVISRAAWVWEGSVLKGDGTWSTDTWVEIPGSSGTQERYTATAILSFTAKSSDKGRRYRCVVTAQKGNATSVYPTVIIGNWAPVSNGTEYSNPATLTVT